MKTKTWIFIFVSALALCLIFSCFLLGSNADARFARITSDGHVVRTVDLSLDQEFTVPGPGGGYNIVTVQDGKIAVTEASCPDHYCMHRGFCSGGAQIVCLPNRLVIEFLGEQEVDGIIG